MSTTRKSAIHPFRYSFTTCFKERVIVDLLHLQSGAKVLEMGCGSAYFETVLRRRFPDIDFSYVGVDMSRDSVSISKRFIHPEKSDLFVGDVSKLPMEDSSFDIVLYLDVIEHVADDKASLAEARRVLKPGGTLIVSTPNMGAPLVDTFFCEYLHDHGLMDNHRAGYTEMELNAMLRNVGFQTSSVNYSNVFLSEILITITKLGYRLKKQNYSSQADMLEVSDSLLFKVHKCLLFPLGFLIGRLEELLFVRILKGHCMIIRATK